MRHGAMWCLYCPSQWGSNTVLCGPSVAGGGQGSDDHRGAVARSESPLAARLVGRRRTAMRLLSIRTVDERGRPAPRKATTERCGHRPSDDRKRLSLRHLSSDPKSDSPGCRHGVHGRSKMSAFQMERREFLKFSVAASGGLLI